MITAGNNPHRPPPYLPCREKPLFGEHKFASTDAVLVWALVSRGCRETVELFLDEETAQAALGECLRDEPDWIGVLAVVPLDFAASSVSLN